MIRGPKVQLAIKTTSVNFILPTAISLFFDLCYFLTTHSISIAFTFATWTFSFFVLFQGAILQELLHGQSTADALAAALIGMLSYSLLLLLVAFISPFSILTNFIFICLLTLAFRLWRGSSISLTLDRQSSWTLFIILAGSLLWSQENLAPLRIAGNFIIVRPWIDIFFHSRQIALFANSDGARSLTNYSMSGHQLPVYHYGSYMIPALISRATGKSSFLVARTILSPLGMLWAGLGAYWFGKTLESAGDIYWSGFGAAVAVMLIPDASYQLLGTAWTGYFYFQQVGPGGAFATGVLGLACGYLFLSISKRASKFLIFSYGLVVASILFKVQIALVYSIPLLFFGMFFGKMLGQAFRFLACTTMIAVYLLCIRHLQVVPHAPTIAFSSRGLPLYIATAIHNYGRVTQLRLQRIFLRTDYLQMLLLGGLFLACATYGVWILFAPMIFVSARKARRPAWLLAFPAIILLSHMLVALGLDSNHGYGDPFEVYHKTFVWPYYAVTAWCGSLVVSLKLPKSVERLALRKSTLPTLVCILVLIAGLCGHRNQTRLPWAAGFTNAKVPIGLYDTAMFLRKIAGRQDVVQMTDNDSKFFLGALSERNEFIARLMVNAGPITSSESARFRKVEALLDLPTYSSASKAAKALGIKWLVITPGRSVRWVNDRKTDIPFRSGGYAVVRFG